MAVCYVCMFVANMTETAKLDGIVERRVRIKKYTLKKILFEFH